MSRPKRGYVALGECRQSRSCYVMGCGNAPCLEAHRRYVTWSRVDKLTSGRITHGPSGYDCGCRCADCTQGRHDRYRTEQLQQLLMSRLALAR